VFKSQPHDYPLVRSVRVDDEASFTLWRSHLRRELAVIMASGLHKHWPETDNSGLIHPHENSHNLSKKTGDYSTLNWSDGFRS
jgi:hypothetical protein